MAAIFNQTFTADKPIYYPSGWDSGKTPQQKYEEFTASWGFFFVSNALQVVIAGVWVFVVAGFLVGIKEIIRLKKLKEGNAEKRRNEYFLRMSFLMGICFLGGVIVCINVILLRQDWGAAALAKGLASCSIIYIFRTRLSALWQKFISNKIDTYEGVADSQDLQQRALLEKYIKSD